MVQQTSVQVEKRQVIQMKKQLIKAALINIFLFTVDHISMWNVKGVAGSENYHQLWAPLSPKAYFNNSELIVMVFQAHKLCSSICFQQ